MVIFIIILAIVLICLLSVYIYKESTGYRIVNYDFCDEKLKCEKLKAVFLSDLHNMQYGLDNCELLADIDMIAPDIVIIGGDMITSCAEKWKGYEKALQLVKTLSEKYPVYYGMGNHEARLRYKAKKFPEGTYENFQEALSKLNAPILSNEKVILDDAGIALYCIDLEHKYYRKVITRKLPEDYLNDKLGCIDKNRVNVLLAHNPEHFKSYAAWGADLVLSGHVHGGIVRIPGLGGVISPAYKIFPKYDGGEFIEGNSMMLLSRGIGTHTIPVRINNKAELIVINFKKK